jgi:ParB-like nuclease domain
LEILMASSVPVANASTMNSVPPPPDAPATEWPIADIQVGTRHRKYMGDIEALAASIAEHGLLNPITVKPDGMLIAGERRLAAVQLGQDDGPGHRARADQPPQS